MSEETKRGPDGDKPRLIMAPGSMDGAEMVAKMFKAMKGRDLTPAEMDEVRQILKHGPSVTANDVEPAPGLDKDD